MIDQTRHWSRCAWLAAVAVVSGGPALPLQAQITEASAVTAHLSSLHAVVAEGQPVWVDFQLHNPTSEVAVLSALADAAAGQMTEMGLPRTHVLGPAGTPALWVHDGEGQVVDCPQTLGGSDDSGALRLAPGASVGLRLDLAEVCPALHKHGAYRIGWQPYGGRMVAESIEITVLALKQLLIRTDYGDMRVRPFYEDATAHVQNFIQLAEQGFYDGLTFHRVVEGFLIQGGAPGEDPTAVRPDGKLLQPEFNDQPFIRGTVGMARWPGDPASASCQFFICAKRIPELDGKYTAFGELVGEASFDTLDQLMSQPLDEKDRPTRTVYIRAVRVESAQSR